MMCEACENEGPNLREIWAAADKKAKDWREAGRRSGRFSAGLERNGD